MPYTTFSRSACFTCSFCQEKNLPQNQAAKLNVKNGIVKVWCYAANDFLPAIADVKKEGCLLHLQAEMNGRLPEPDIFALIKKAHAGELEQIMSGYFASIGKAEEWEGIPWQELYEYCGDKVAGAAFERWDYLVEAGEYERTRANEK